MIEEEAQAWLRGRYDAATVERLSRFASMVIEENNRQNLIAPSTVEQIWSRHLVDSAQLVLLAPEGGTWLDIGTGGGFPGIVVAVVRSEPVILVEPRRRRAEFLSRCVDELRLRNTEVVPRKVEAVDITADIISARAVASVENLLHAAQGCATTATRWLLPRGRLEEGELRQLRQRWGGVFHVEQSLTDAESSILVLDRVSRR